MGSLKVVQNIAASFINYAKQLNSKNIKRLQHEGLKVYGNVFGF